MSTPDTDWNPDDGEAPTAEELREAARLAEALAAPAPPAVMTPDTAEALRVAARIRAVSRPDDAAARDAAARAVSAALAAPAARAPARWLARWSPARRRLAAAAAAVLVTAGASGAYLRARLPSEPADRGVFDGPVEPGAGSGPATRLYDHGLRGYREGLLGGAR
jgi:hypothetical protein